MKIIIFSNSLWNIKNFRISLINHLIKNNHKIIIISDTNGNKFNIKNCKFYRLQLPNKIFSLKIFFLLLKLRKIYSNENPDLILNFTIQPIILSSIVSIIGKYKFINIFTGLGSIFIKKNYISNILKSICKIITFKSTYTIFQNKDDQNYFSFNNELITKCKIIAGSGVDTKYYEYNEINKKNDDFIFLFVGRIIKDKGVLELIEVAKQIYNINKKIKFKILGSFDQTNPSKISNKKFLNLIDNVKNISYLAFKKDVRQEIINSHCIVLPSYREGLPMSLLEAASIGRPIIATNVPGCKDIVIDGKSGFLVDPRNINDLYNKILFLSKLSLNDLKKMGNFNRKNVVENFNNSIINDQYLKIINENFKY